MSIHHDISRRHMLAMSAAAMTGMGGAQTTDDGYFTLYGENSDRVKPLSVLMAMTNAAAAKVGDLPDSGPSGGPNLAQSRAEYIAKALGGTIEKASTAITQSQWTPRPTISRTYTREQLDTAFQAMMAEGRKAMALSAYPTPHEPAGFFTDFNA